MMERTTRLFTKGEIRRIFGNAPSLESKVFFVTTYYCGNRIGETTHIRVRDVQQDSLLKWDSKKKVVKKIPINEDLYRLICLYMYERRLKPHHHLFQKSHRTYNRYLKKLCEKLGIGSEGNNIRVHSFRHSRCSHLNDISLARFLTNDSILTIYRTYRELDYDVAKDKLLSIEKREEDNLLH